MQENTHLLTMGVTVSVAFIAVLAGVFLNNRRLTDVKEALRAEMKAESAELRTLIERQHSEMMIKLSDMDARMSRLESERRLIS